MWANVACDENHVKRPIFGLDNVKRVMQAKKRERDEQIVN